jgi:predicted branched-subunit amino acid permease
VFAVGVSFGFASRPIIGMVPTDIMSVVVFGASAQTAAVGTLAAGGVIAAAVSAGLLINLRFLPMSVAVGPSLPSGRWRRALAAQAIVDASWAMARRDDGTFDWPMLVGATIPQAAGWWAGTAIGAAVHVCFPASVNLGLEAVFPAFFLALLGEELRRLPNAAVALAGALIALGLTPVLPAGLPVTAAAAAAFLGIALPSAKRRHAS